MKQMYPEIKPYKTGFLKVSDLHNIYYEEAGNPDGKPVVFLHGGPGGGITDSMRRYFDPIKWRIILFDQRGCGKSTPFAELKENTTWDLVADTEKIREHLKISKWSVLAHGDQHLPWPTLSLIQKFVLNSSSEEFFF